MTYMSEPLDAVEENDLATGAAKDGELTSLVRRWMAVGTTVQDRARSESILRVAPDPARVDPARVEPESVEAFAPLPRHAVGTATDEGDRVALLVDARRTSADVASGLLARLGERGSVQVCRAYAGWGSADLGDWGGRTRGEGLHSFDHVSYEDDQALVAMAIDAVDIARDGVVDEVVLVGDLTSALPLVHRLHAAAVRVLAVGSGHTPDDVRAACDEFIDMESVDLESVDLAVDRESVDLESVDRESIDGVRGVAEGRHRA